MADTDGTVGVGGYVRCWWCHGEGFVRLWIDVFFVLWGGGGGKGGVGCKTFRCWWCVRSGIVE